MSYNPPSRYTPRDPKGRFEIVIPHGMVRVAVGYSEREALVVREIGAGFLSYGEDYAALIPKNLYDRYQRAKRDFEDAERALTPDILRYKPRRR